MTGMTGRSGSEFVKGAWVCLRCQREVGAAVSVKPRSMWRRIRFAVVKGYEICKAESRSDEGEISHRFAILSSSKGRSKFIESIVYNPLLKGRDYISTNVIHTGTPQPRDPWVSKRRCSK